MMGGEEEAVEVQEPAAATTAEGEGKGEGGMDAGIGKYKVHIAEQQLPLVGMFFTAMVLLIAVTTGARSKTNSSMFAYGVSVASVAMVFSLIGLLLTLKEDLNAKVGKYNSIFLFLWCFIGAIILTFWGPFQVTGNGYFAAWGLTICSVMGIGISGEAMKSAVTGLGSLLGLFVSAIIVIIAISDDIRGSYRGIAIYSLVVACLTTLVAGTFIYLRRGGGGPSKTKFIVLAFFAILWIVLACLTTFRGPFLATGNGYFGSWGGAATSVFAAMAELS